MNPDELLVLARVRALCASGTARSIRLAAGLHQTEVAGAVAVSAAAVSRWEAGLRTPTGDAAVRYGRLLEELLRR